MVNTCVTNDNQHVAAEKNEQSDGKDEEDVPPAPRTPSRPPCAPPIIAVPFPAPLPPLLPTRLSLRPPLPQLLQRRSYSEVSQHR
jgi:hypothetical protein